MKKTLLVLSAIATLFAFVSCGGGAEPDGPAKSDTNTTTPETPAVSEKVFSEKEAGLDNCSAVALYADLKEVADAHADAKVIILVKNTSGAGRTGWGCGPICTSTDPNDCYNTFDVKLIEDYKPTGLANDGDTEEIEISLATIMAAIKEGGCLSYNLYNGIVAIKVYAKW